MGNCNCKVNQHITYLHKKYGNKIPVSKQTKIRFTVKEFFTKILIYLISILFLPIILMYILYISLFTKKKQTNIKKLLNLKEENVRN